MGIINRFFPRLLAGQSKEKWQLKQKGSYGLQEAEIKNKLLAGELEKECSKNGGVLTYAQYLQIEQFGIHGYHASHSSHGMTGTYKTWEKALFLFCKNNNISSVVEIGFGDGKLAKNLLKEAKKQNYKLTWGGVEINKDLKDKAEKMFKGEKLYSQISFLVSSISEIPLVSKSLFLFSYSLDSVAPEIVISTNQKGTADAFLGVTIKNGIAKEIVLSGSMLRQKNYEFKNGVLKNTKGVSFDLSKWKLKELQRLYCPINAFSVLHEVLEKAQIGSDILIIDEFRKLPSEFEKYHHYAPPVVLYTSMEKRYDFVASEAYKTAGSQLFYYPFFLSSYYSLLQFLGFSNIKYAVEEEMAYKIQNQTWIKKPNRIYFCFSISGKLKKKVKKEIFSIDPPKEILTSK